MTKAIGRLANLGIGREASRGVGVAAEFWVPKITLSYDDKVTKVTSALSYGSINVFGNQSLVAQKWAEGTIEGEVLDRSFGLLMYALFGTVSSASVSGAYTHTYTLAETNQHQSLSMYIDEPNGDLLFELAMIESMELTFDPNDVVKFTVDFKSKSAAGSSASATYVAQNKFLGKHLALKIAATTGDLAAATAISPKSLKLTINKNLMLDQVLGTVQPEDILNQGFSITGELELVYDNRTYANYMLDGTYRAMRIDLVNTDVTIGSTNPSFRLDLSRVEFSSWEPTRNNDEVMVEKINFSALWDITNENVINSCYVINETASY